MKPTSQSLKAEPPLSAKLLWCLLAAGALFSLMIGRPTAGQNGGQWQLAPNGQDFRFSQPGSLQVVLDQKKFSPWIDTQVPVSHGQYSCYRVDSHGVEIQFWDGTGAVDSGQEKIWFGIKKGIFRLRGTGIATVTVGVSQSS